MSILMPLGLFLNVGGNNENMAKLMVVAVLCAAPVGWIVTTNRLFVSDALEVGRSGNCTCAHCVREPRTLTEPEASTFPAFVCSAMLSFPVKLEVDGKRKKKDALYVHEESTLIPSKV